MAVGQAAQLGTVVIPAAGLLPQSAGCTTGMETSMAPALFISSRTMFSIFFSTRKAGL